jgi:hypothetical protein
MSRGYIIRRWKFTGKGDVLLTLGHDRGWWIATNQPMRFVSKGEAMAYAQRMIYLGTAPPTRTMVIGPRGGNYHVKRKKR